VASACVNPWRAYLALHRIGGLHHRENTELSKDDIVVCYGSFTGHGAGEWYEVLESSYELLPPRLNPTYGFEMGEIKASA
jgi:hypothetical protein